MKVPLINKSIRLDLSSILKFVTVILNKRGLGLSCDSLGKSGWSEKLSISTILDILVDTIIIGPSGMGNVYWIV